MLIFTIVPVVECYLWSLSLKCDSIEHIYSSNKKERIKEIMIFSSSQLTMGTPGINPDNKGLALFMPIVDYITWLLPDHGSRALATITLIIVSLDVPKK